MIAAILAGGASRRFGSDKATVIGGTVRDAARAAGCDPVVAVGGTAGESLGLITVPDRRPGEGPLAALGSVLLWAGPDRVLVLPCDLPLLQAEHLAPLLAAARDPLLAPNHAIVALVNGRPAHEVAIWPGSIGRTIWQAIERGERALRAALDLVEWQGIEVNEAGLRDADTEDELATHQAQAIVPHATPPATPD